MMAGLAGWAQQSQEPVASPPVSTVSTDVAVTIAGERSQVVPTQETFWFKGGGADAAVTFWKGLGIAAAFTGDRASNTTPGVDVSKIAFLAGPRYTYTAWQGHASPADQRRLQIFAQGLFGSAHALDGLYPNGTGLATSANSFAVQAGGGVNLYLTQHWGLRLIESDYVRTQLPNAAANAQNDFRLAAGVTYHLQAAAPLPVTLACAASPSSVFAGDPVAVSATAGNLNPRLHAIYNWSGAGVTGSGATATVDTAALASGSYTVQCGVKEGKPGKEGLKPWESADASASFTVKPFEPPTVGCSASPTTLKPGETSTITATGVSPQNRPLTYSYSATAGAVAGTGATAEFNSAGAPTGAVSITCNVSDDKGQTATANTTVTILAPYVPPAPHTQALCPLNFSKDKKRPARVDNEAKACLDEVALELQRQPDAKAVVVGNADAKDKSLTAKEEKLALKHKHAEVVNLAAERAVNAKEYLVTEKGIDGSRVNVATGAADGKTAQDYLVPAGASFSSDVTGTTPVDESAVKPQPRKPLSAKHTHKKPAANQ
jgi:outer membrane protein OmpA-like peptidoglycan-associated protein